MLIEEKIVIVFQQAIKELYSAEIAPNQIQLQTTRKEFKGDITIVVFPVVRLAKKSPEDTANQLGEYFVQQLTEITGFNVIKGFLNLEIDANYWLNLLQSIFDTNHFGLKKENSSGITKMVEYSSPNTNKPLHLGHIRNNLLGFAVSNILKANGHKVVRINLVNDRGIHICKSMLAWKRWGNGETPQSSGLKGDHLVGKYYVMFDQEYKAEIKGLMELGKSEDEAKAQAPLILEAQEMLRKWEAGDKQTVELWSRMNSWVYEGFDVTYRNLGVEFDAIQYESNTYKLGKSIVLEGLDKGILEKRDDGSVWADLTDQGLDQKLLLRKDGTSVYMTQDIGTAHQRFTNKEWGIDEALYVVGNEQNYHFQVLSIILDKLGYDWAKKLKHLSYGMVELPEGKMKSREGTVVDADDLIKEMVDTAREMSLELGKLEGLDEKEKQQTFEMIGLGALKYYILKVDPKKTMMFNPRESIDFNGNTGPFIQYTHARIKSVLRKAAEKNIQWNGELNEVSALSEKEIQLIKHLNKFPTVVNEAGDNYSPALIANYTYDLVKEFNQFYHDHQMINETDEHIRKFRLKLAHAVANVVKDAMKIIGIDVPERM